MSGFAQWATGVRNRMVADPGRTDFKDQVQYQGFLFLHEYLDDVLNVPRPENLIEFTKTPGRNRTAKKARTVAGSAQKIKPVAPISFGPTDKENDASEPVPKPSQPKARPAPAPAPAADPAPNAPRDSISRATPVRPGVPIFSPANHTPALPTPAEDPSSPFRAPSPKAEAPAITASDIFTTKLVIPSSPQADPEPEPTKQSQSETQPTEVDLSIIQEDDEGHSTFEDARDEFHPATDVEDTETAEPVRLPSPPPSEDTPAPSSKPCTPIKVAEHEPTEPISSSNVLVAEVPEVAPVPAPEPVQVVEKPASVSQPTPPPEPVTTTSRPLPIPPLSRTNSDSGSITQGKPVSSAAPAQLPAPVAPAAQPTTAPAQPTTATTQPTTAPALNPRTSAVPRGQYNGPSLKELRREPSVSGHRELRQSSWRKKPDGSNPAPAEPEPPKLKRKSSTMHTARAPPKSQKRSPSPSSGSEEETEMQVPLKDEDSGSNFGSGSGSMLEDLRNRLARLEKSTSGKTPAVSRVWSSGGEKRLSLSELSVRPAPVASVEDKEPEEMDLGMSTDNPAASMLSNRTTTPDNSPPPVRRVLPAPPVFTLPEPAKATESSAKADEVRAKAKADAARLFGGTKFTAPAPARTETQSTTMTDVDSVFDMRSQTQTQTTISSQSQSVFGPGQTQEEDDLADLNDELDMELDEDVDVEGNSQDELEEDKTSGTSSLVSSTTQTRSMATKGPVKSIQLAAAAAKKAAEEKDRKATRMREMEERRQAAAALRKTEDDKSRTLELEKKRKEREELAKSVKVPVKKPVAEDPNKKRKVEAEKKPAEVKKPAVPAAPSTTKSRIAKPTAAAGPGPSGLKSALKTSQNPFPAPTPPAPKTLKPTASSSSLKSTAAKKAKGSISDAPGRALQEQMQARVQAQIKAAQKEPEVQSENIELPDINSEYSDSDDEDRGKDFPEWTQNDELMQALKDQETFNPDALFGPIQPLKMGDLFKTGHARFRKRTSSANWAGTDGITVEEEIEYARRMGYTNQ